MIRCPETGVAVFVTQFQQVLGQLEDNNYHWQCPFCEGTYHLVPCYRQFGIDLETMDLSNFSFEKLAGSLAKLPRWGGHTDYMYSVGSHQLILSELIEEEGGTPEDQYGGLLHDGHESILGGDFPRPMKLLLGDTYRQIENRADAAMVAKWSFVMTPLVKFWDDQILYIESTILGAELNKGFQLQRKLTLDQARRAANKVEEHCDRPWRSVKYEYIQRFLKLTNGHGVL